MRKPVSLDEAAEERAGNWTIKQVPLRTRLRASAAARKAGQPMWQWLEGAVELAAAQQEQNTVTPPGPTEANNHTKRGQLSLVPSAGTQLIPVDNQPQPRRLELHDLVQMARAMTPPDKDSEAMRLARSLIRDRLKVLRDEA